MRTYMLLLLLACAACGKDNDPEQLSLDTDVSGEIAFISRRVSTGDWQMYIMNLDGSNQRELSNKYVSCAPFAPSHDGQKIAFSTYENNTRYLYVMDKKGGTPLLLASAKQFCGNPVWSPDDSKIVFVKGDDVSSTRYDIYVTGSDGTHQQRLTTDKANFSPQWFPDGKTIVFAANDNGNCGIYTMRADGSGQKRISPAGRCFGSPQVSPAGNKIAMVSADWEGSQIFVTGVDGANLKQLTTTVNPKYHDTGFPKEGNHSPVWSPDGSKIAYVSWANGTPDIFVMNPDGNNKKELTNSEKRDENPCWTKDGKYIVFSTSRDVTPNGFEIYIMKANGQSQTALTKYMGDDAFPVFVKH